MAPYLNISSIGEEYENLNYKQTMFPDAHTHVIPLNLSKQPIYCNWDEVTSRDVFTSYYNNLNGKVNKEEDLKESIARARNEGWPMEFEAERLKKNQEASDEEFYSMMRNEEDAGNYRRNHKIKGKLSYVLGSSGTVHVGNVGTDHGILTTVVECWNQHAIFQTCPDDWWFTITKIIALHLDKVNQQDSERDQMWRSDSENQKRKKTKQYLRNFFVDHDGKKELYIQTGVEKVVIGFIAKFIHDLVINYTDMITLYTSNLIMHLLQMRFQTTLGYSNKIAHFSWNVNFMMDGLNMFSQSIFCKCREATLVAFVILSFFTYSFHMFTNKDFLIHKITGIGGGGV